MSAPYRIFFTICLAASAALGQNLYPNADFNDADGITGWVADPGTVSFDTDDASGCPASGSLVAVSEQIAPVIYNLDAHGPCLVFAQATTVDASFLYRGGVGCGLCDAFAALNVYSNNACLGIAIDGVSSYFQEVPTWTRLEGTFDVPAGGSIGVRAGGGGDSISVVEFDEIRVTAPGYVFLEDFDGGGTCRWSSSVE